MALDQYLQLLDWTGRQIRAGKAGAIPAHLAPILERLTLNSEVWLDVVTHFGDWFHRAVGRVSSMAARAVRSSGRWHQGIGRCRLAFM